MTWREFTIVIGLTVVLFLSAIHSEVDKDLRYEDKPFPSMIIAGRNVTCHRSPDTGQFPSHTWTCKDIRVNSVRMAYGYNPNLLGKEHECTETKGQDELGELCRRMMEMIGTTKELWIALVSNASCEYIHEKRTMFNLSGTGSHQWDDMSEGFGWVNTLQCMALRDGE